MVEPVVLDPPAGDARLLAGGPGDGRGACVRLQAAGVGEPCAVVPDLGEYPGAELGAEPGEAQDHVSVRVLRERLLHRPGEVVGGDAGGLQLAQKGEHLLAERILDQGRLVGEVAAEDFTNPLGLGLDAAFTAGSPECAGDLRTGQFRGPARGRRGFEEFAGFGPAQAVLPGCEGVQGGGVVLAQQGAELVGHLLTVPGGVLLGAGQDGDRAGEVGVVRQRPVCVHIRAQDVRQDQGVARVGLLAQDTVPVAVAGRGQRIDREYLPPALSQHRDQQAARGLDGDRNRGLVGIPVLSEQVEQELVAGRVVGDVTLRP